MATRTLTVALRALIAGYTGPMRAAAAATGPLEASLLRVQRAGLGMAAVGAVLTRRVSLPLAAVGAVAVKLALDFEQAMTKVATLTAASASEVDGMRDRILDLSATTGRSAVELARGLFVAVSATRDTSTGFEILERAAMAAALGLGTTEDIARAAASVINAYGVENIDAAHATDVLVSTAQAGNFEVSQFAGALGRVLPFAKAANVAFEDVGGAVALLTATTGDANIAVTQLTGLLRTFVTPTRQTEAELAKLGLTAADVRDHLGEHGLVATLQMLDERLGGNREQLGRIIGRAEGTSAAIQILDADVQSLNETFGTTHNATMALEDAYAILEETSGHKLRQALMQLQGTLIRVGDTLAPLAVSAAEFAAKLLEAFDRLPRPMQNFLVQVGVLAAAFGPLLRIGGTLATVFGRAGMALANFAVPAGAVAGTAGKAAAGLASMSTAMRGLFIATGIGAALFILIELIDKFAGASGEAANQQDALTMALRQTGGALEGIALEEFINQLGEVAGFASVDAIEMLQKLGITADELVRAIDGGDAAWAQFMERLDETSRNAGLTKDELEGLFPRFERMRDRVLASREELEAWNAIGIDAQGMLGGLEDEVLGTADAFEEATSAIKAYSDALSALFDPLFGALDATRSLDDAQRSLSEAQDRLNELQSDSSASAEDLAQAQRDVEQAHIDVTKAALGQEQAFAELQDAVNRGDVAFEDAVSTLQRWVANGDISAETAMILTARLGETTDAAMDLTTPDWVVAVSEVGTEPTRRRIEDATAAARVLDRQQPNVRVTERGAAGTRLSMAAVEDAANRIPRHISITMRLSGAGAVGGELAAARRALEGRPRQHGGPVWPGQAFLVGEQGPELAFFGQRGHIMPHGQSMSMLAGMRPAAAVGGGVNFNISFSGSAVVRSGRMLDQEIMQSLRHGNLQMVAVDSDTGKRHRVRVG